MTRSLNLNENVQQGLKKLNSPLLLKRGEQSIDIVRTAIEVDGGNS